MPAKKPVKTAVVRSALRKKFFTHLDKQILAETGASQSTVTIIKKLLETLEREEIAERGRLIKTHGKEKALEMLKGREFKGVPRRLDVVFEYLRRTTDRSNAEIAKALGMTVRNVRILRNRLGLGKNPVKKHRKDK